jgi:hypothetical protein
MSRRTSEISVVLDSSCVLGTPRSALRALKRRGMKIHVSGLVLSELAVHFRDYDPRQDNDKHQRRWRARMKVLSELLGDPPPFAPTHDPLIDKLGGKRKGARPIPFLSWSNDMRIVWQAIMTSETRLAPAISSKINDMADYVKETGIDFIETSGVAATRGPSVRDPVVLPPELDEMIPNVLDEIWLPTPPTAKARFDAHSRMLGYHIDSAYDRANSRGRAHTENDAIDLNMLHHLVDGLAVVTRDYVFVENVDRCGTIQAPWVRTVGELLAGHAPTGQPFTDDAKREAASHRPRDRAELSLLDEAEASHAKQEDGRA